MMGDLKFTTCGDFMEEQDTTYIDQYKEFYNNGGYENNDPVMRAKDDIKKMLKKFDCKSLLDYGCGHGLQYSQHKLDEYWDIKKLVKYDPGVKEFETKPTGTFDAVINTDVLEHIPEEYVYDVITDIFSYADKFVYFSIATGLAKAVLPNGENAHCTLKPHSEWVTIIDEMRGDIPTLVKCTGRDRRKIGSTLLE